MELQKTPNSQAILRKISKVETITLPDFKLYYKDTIIKIVWPWQKNKHTDQQNRIELRNKSHVYGQLIFDKGAKNIYTPEKEKSLQHMVLEKLSSHLKKNDSGLLSDTINTNKLKMN